MSPFRGEEMSIEIFTHIWSLVKKMKKKLAKIKKLKFHTSLNNFGRENKKIRKKRKKKH